MTRATYDSNVEVGIDVGINVISNPSKRVVIVLQKSLQRFTQLPPKVSMVLAVVLSKKTFRAFFYHLYLVFENFLLTLLRNRYSKHLKFYQQ